MAATTYATDSEVRKEAGFEYNTDITDSQIEGARVRAFSLINSKIGARYSLPLSDNSCFDTSPAKDVVKNIELLLASGYLLITEYWNESIGTDKDGYKKRDLAEKTLNDVVAGMLLFLCADGSEFTTNSNLWVEQTQKLNIGGLPTTDTDRVFTVGKRF